jgi:hypothetical protein
MPQKPDLIATKTVKGDVYVFDRTKHETKAPKGGHCKPDIRLKGQKEEGRVGVTFHVENVLIPSSIAMAWLGTRSTRDTSSVQAMTRRSHIGTFPHMVWLSRSRTLVRSMLIHQGYQGVQQRQQQSATAQEIHWSLCRSHGKLDRRAGYICRLSQDVDWHAEHSYMFGSVGDDKQLMM